MPRPLRDILALVRLALTPIPFDRRYPYEYWSEVQHIQSAEDVILDRRWIAEANARLDR